MGEGDGGGRRGREDRGQHYIVLSGRIWEFGLEELPPGERREAVLRGEGEEGEAAGYCSGRGKAEFGLE